MRHYNSLKYLLSYILANLHVVIYNVACICNMKYALSNKKTNMASTVKNEVRIAASLERESFTESLSI